MRIKKKKKKNRGERFEVVVGSKNRIFFFFFFSLLFVSLIVFSLFSINNYCAFVVSVCSAHFQTAFKH